jgi:hypothetical protein
MQGYHTQLLEFIDMEHTPKNILIRAVRSGKMIPAAVKRQRVEAYEKCRDFFGAAPMLEKLLGGQGIQGKLPGAVCAGEMEAEQIHE